jgi:hypothetical protein
MSGTVTTNGTQGNSLVAPITASQGMIGLILIRTAQMFDEAATQWQNAISNDCGPVPATALAYAKSFRITLNTTGEEREFAVTIGIVESATPLTTTPTTGYDFQA